MTKTTLFSLIGSFAMILSFGYSGSVLADHEYICDSCTFHHGCGEVHDARWHCADGDTLGVGWSNTPCTGELHEVPAAEHHVFEHIIGRADCHMGDSHVGAAHHDDDHHDDAHHDDHHDDDHHDDTH